MAFALASNEASKALSLAYQYMRRRRMRAKAICDPDPVLLIDAKMERSHERFARFNFSTLADDPAFGWIALWEVEELAL